MTTYTVELLGNQITTCTSLREAKAKARQAFDRASTGRRDTTPSVEIYGRGRVWYADQRHAAGMLWYCN